MGVIQSEAPLPRPRNLARELPLAALQTRTHTAPLNTSRALLALLAACTLALGGCSTAPRLPVAQVQAACPALEALPAGTDAAALYRQCRDAVLTPLNTDPHALPPPVLCTARPGSSAGALGPWAGVCQ